MRFEQNKSVKVQILRLATADIKINQTCYVIFQTTSQLFVKYCISVMRHKTSLLFHLKICMLCSKGANQSTIFQTFQCSNESSPISHAIFEATTSEIIPVLQHCSVPGIEYF